LKPAADVLLGHRDHQAQVGLDHLLAGLRRAVLDQLGELDLVVLGQQLDPADLLEVRAHGIVQRRADLRLVGFRPLGSEVARQRRSRSPHKLFGRCLVSHLYQFVHHRTYLPTVPDSQTIPSCGR